VGLSALPHVGVAIVTYNSATVLPRCLASLRGQAPGVRVTTVVVDNGSRDDTVALVRERFPEVRLIEAPRNGGFSYGTNLALAALGLLDRADNLPAAPLDYVLFLNPDTELPPDTLRPLCALLAQRPEIGAVSPLLVRADSTPDWACHRGFPTPWNALCHVLGLDRRWPRMRVFGGYNLSYRPLDRAGPVDAIAGAFMLVRADAARTVGRWDEAYFAYGEDIDYCLRLRRAGWRTWYEPGIRVLHLKGAASSQRSLPMLREFYRAMLVYYRKHHAPHDPLPLRLAVSWGIRALYAGELLRQRAQPAAQRWVGAARPVKAAR
jgi:GT2 family glycosyltransferase